MATRNGVGESNELVKLLDEIQVEIPEKFKDFRVYDSLEKAQQDITGCIAKGQVFDGHYVKAGKVIAEPRDDGKIEIIRCPVGELAVRCVEKASRMMKLPLLITGDYLCGYSWADAH